MPTCSASSLSCSCTSTDGRFDRMRWRLLSAERQPTPDPMLEHFTRVPAVRDRNAGPQKVTGSSIDPIGTAPVLGRPWSGSRRSCQPHPTRRLLAGVRVQWLMPFHGRTRHVGLSWTSVGPVRIARLDAMTMLASSRGCARLRVVLAGGPSLPPPVVSARDHAAAPSRNAAEPGGCRCGHNARRPPIFTGAPAGSTAPPYMQTCRHAEGAGSWCRRLPWNPSRGAGRAPAAPISGSCDQPVACRSRTPPTSGARNP